jgi:hypothetical protein
MKEYARVLKSNGFLLLSGFYEGDHDKISSVSGQFSLEEIRSLKQNEWMALLLQRH